MAKKNEIAKTENKPKREPRGKNSPVIGNNGLMVEAGDNTKYLQKNLVLMNLPDIDMHNVEQVSERLNFYFNFMAENDSKPTVSGMAMSLNGMSRQMLWSIAHDKPTGGCGYKPALPSEVAYVIKKAYKIMETLWEDYMQNGKINPVSGIFLGKNNFAYQDKTEYVLTPNANNDSDIDADSIKSRYLIDSESDSGE